MTATQPITETRLSVLIKNLPTERRKALLDQLEISKRTFLNYYTNPSRVPYAKLRKIADFINTEYGKNYLITELIEPVI